MSSVARKVDPVYPGTAVERMNNCMARARSLQQDVAHVQFRSRIAFKLVWCPPSFSTFVLVDDEGGLLAGPAAPTGQLPHLRDRQQNYALVRGSKYAKEAEASEVS